jgi:hypothetical protein
MSKRGVQISQPQTGIITRDNWFGLRDVEEVVTVLSGADPVICTR